MKTGYWYIRTDTTFTEEDGVSYIVELRSKRIPRIKIGDTILLLDRELFTHSGLVLQTSYENDKEQSIYEKRVVKVGDLTRIESPNSLSDFAYSLPKIYKHFSKPYRHFIRSYGRLSEVEVDIILNKKIFLSRTACGKIFESLHDIHKQLFISFVSIEHPKILTSYPIDYFNLFEILNKYINSNIFSHVNFLKSSIRIMQKHQWPDLGFSEEEELTKKKTDTILGQFEVLTKAEENMGKGLGFVAEGISQYKQEEKFSSSLFKDSWLPKILNP